MKKFNNLLTFTGHEWMRAKWSAPIRKYWKISEQMMVKYCDLAICDSVNIEKYIHECYDGKGIKGRNPKTTFIAYGADLTLSKLSWVERNEERGWTEEIISEFIKKSKVTHPIYQFRLFCTLNHIKEHLDYMAEKSKVQGYVLRTVDGAPLKEELFAEVWERACDMIFSFEYAFKACWNADERGSLEKIRDGLNIIRKAAPENDKEVPFLMGYMETAQKELESYEKQWPEILEKLNKYGMFFKMGK